MERGAELDPAGTAQRRGRRYNPGTVGERFGRPRSGPANWTRAPAQAHSMWGWHFPSTGPIAKAVAVLEQREDGRLFINNLLCTVVGVIARRVVMWLVDLWFISQITLTLTSCIAPTFSEAWLCASRFGAGTNRYQAGYFPG